MRGRCRTTRAVTGACALSFRRTTSVDRLTRSNHESIFNHMVNQIGTLNGVFAALSDPTRRRILERLTRRDLTAGAIAAGFSISPPAVSKHLKVLERCGLLKRTIVGREHYCRLNPRVMCTAAGWIETQERFWNRRFDSLDELLSRSTDDEER
jgi:DNA-binding transcriptional ArsR family regulator